MNTPLFSWVSPRKITNKSPIWYLIAIIIVLTLVVYGISQKLWIMPIVALLFAWVYMLHENNAPDTIITEVTETGISSRGNFYDFAKIESFAILYVNDIPYILRLRTLGSIPPLLDIYLTEWIDIVALRDILLTRVREDTTAKITFADNLIHLLKL